MEGKGEGDVFSSFLSSVTSMFHRLRRCANRTISLIRFASYTKSKVLQRLLRSGDFSRSFSGVCNKLRRCANYASGLDCRGTFFTGADTNCFLNRHDEDLSIANLSGRS